MRKICHLLLRSQRLRSCLPIMLLLHAAASAAGAQTASALIGDDRPRISGPLSLQDAVTMTLDGNLTIQAMQFEADAAHRETTAAEAMKRPQLSANTYLATGSMSNILSSAPGVSPSGWMFVPGRSFADQNLMLMVPLYTGGRLGNLVKAASGREGAAQADVGGARADAVYLVREFYYRALVAAEMVKTAEARADAATAMLDVAQVQFEAGKGIQASVARAAAELADAKRMLATARNDRLKILLDLRRVMGVAPDSDITLLDTLAFTPSEGSLQADLAEAAQIRPELVAARARRESAAAETAAARGARRPQIYGAAMADAFAPRDMNRNTGGTVGVTMSFPLFDSGERGAEIGKKEALERRNDAELKDLELRVATEVRQAWLDLNTAEENYRAARSALDSMQAAYDVIVVRVENQKSILVEQLDALAALTAARENLSRALFEHSIARARLDRAIGRY